MVDIDGVRNVWVSKNQKIQYGLDRTTGTLVDVSVEDLPTFPHAILLNGLFDILLEYEDFVEEENRIARLGLLEEDEEALNAADFISVNGEGILVKTWYDVTLDRVHIYHNNTNVDVENNLRVNLLRVVETGPHEPVTTKQFTLTADSVEQKYALELGFELEAGQTYLLQAATSSTVELYRNPVGNFPYHLIRVADLRSGFDGTEVDSWFYFYDWERDMNRRKSYHWSIVSADFLQPIKRLKSISKLYIIGPN